MGRISLASNTLGIVAAAALIPWIGTWGAIVALVLQGLCFRIAVRLPARRLRPIPFQDTWAVAGCAALLAAYAVKLAADPGLGGDVVLLVTAEVTWLGAAPLAAPDVFAALRRSRSVDLPSDEAADTPLDPPLIPPDAIPVDDV